MNVINCRKCGKLFNYIAGNKICPMCKEASEQKFQEVKKYIQQHGHCSMTEVCEECDVETSQIQAWKDCSFPMIPPLKLLVKVVVK